MPNLVMDVNINPLNQASPTQNQINSPTPFNTPFQQERTSAVGNMAIVGAVGLAGKQVFSAVTGSVGAYTGRQDLQRRINRGIETFGRLSLLGGAFVSGGPVAAGIVAGSMLVESVVGRFQFNLDIQNRNKEAQFKLQSLGNLRNGSRSD